MRASLLMAALALSGCGGSESDAPPPAAAQQGLLELSQLEGGVSASGVYAEREVERCTLQQRMGACESFFCPAGSERPPERLDAGTLSIGGAVLPRGLDGEYYDSLFTPFPHEQEVVAEATGSSSVPAHRLSVMAPAALEFSVPPRAIPVFTSRALDFVPRWTPAGDGHVLVRLLGLPGGSATVVSCRAPVSAGEVVVPAALIEELPLPDENVSYRIELEVNNVTTRRAADWELTLTASDVILWGDLVLE